MTQDQVTECRQCGTCCKNGGPALHFEDTVLLQSGGIPLTSLIALRKGELAHNPVAGRVQPLSVELVKLRGVGRSWHCLYYSEVRGCTIYAHRPHACRTLKCWDTGEILRLVETRALDRITILGKDHQMVPLIREHEANCPYGLLADLYAGKDRLDKGDKKKLEELVRYDLGFRNRVVRENNIDLSLELFYFGRPLFQLLQPLGVRTVEAAGSLFLRW